jgi:hypothetical protein
MDRSSDWTSLNVSTEAFLETTTIGPDVELRIPPIS